MQSDDKKQVVNRDSGDENAAVEQGITAAPPDDDLTDGYINRVEKRDKNDLEDYVRESLGDKYDEIVGEKDEKDEAMANEARNLGVGDIDDYLEHLREGGSPWADDSLPGQITAGTGDALRNSINAIGDIGDALGDIFGMEALEGKGEGIGDSIVPKVPLSDSKTNTIARSATQFLVGFIPLFKAAKVTAGAIKLPGTVSKIIGKKGVKKLGKRVVLPEVAGAGASFMVFDPKDERLSNLINKLVPALRNPVTEYLATSPDDSAAEGRFKSALEGLGLGALMEGVFQAFRGIRASYGVSKVQVEGQVADTKAFKKKDRLPGSKPSFTKKDKETGEVILNVDAIRTPDDLSKGIATLANLEKKRFEAKRGVRGHEVTLQASRILEMKIDDILKFSKGTVKNAEELITIARIVDEQHGKIMELSKRVLAGEDVGKQLLKEADILGLVDPKFFGVSGELGRALEAHKLIQDTAGRLLTLSESLVMADGNMTIKQFATMLLTQKTPKQMSRFMQIIKKLPNMITEVWLAGLLSSIRTHEINILGNTSTMLIAVPERLVASAFGRGVQKQEAMDLLFGMIHSFKDGLRLMGKTLKTGVPKSELTKLEGRAFKKAISAEELGLSGTAGRAADMLGEFVRLPFRGLMAMDDFFKFLNYNAELHALARRTARERGLTGDKAAKLMFDIIHDPPPQIARMAENFSAYQTFTNELGDIGKSVQGIANAHPSMRFALPFIRTPVNIFKYSLERTPFAWILKQVRRDIKAGGAKGSLAYSRMCLGSMSLFTFGMLANAGYFTGSGPQNRTLRNQKMQTGWRPYSMLVGDKYVSYNRLDPIGMLIGIAADLSEARAFLSFEEADELALAVVLAISRNMTSKTYLTGLRNALEIISLGSDKNIGFGTSALKKFVGSFLPTQFRDWEKGLDPSIREMDTWWKAFKANTPYFSQDVPLMRNLFGEPIDLQGGLIGSIASPVYISNKVDDPVMDEIINQEVVVGRLPSFLFGKRPSRFGKPDPDDGVKLTEEQHDRYKVLAGENLREDLEELMNSSDYISGSDGPLGQKHMQISSKITDHREMAKNKLLEEFPELIIAIEERKIRLNLELQGWGGIETLEGGGE